MNATVLQGSDEWRALRIGKATASRIADIIATTKSGFSTSRANYGAQLIAERLTGVAVEGYISAEMQWGTDKEADAKAAYEFITNQEVELVGFDAHPTVTMSGSSPDGIVGSEGMVEFKCPLTATHIETLLGGSIPGKYITQVQWQMACRPERKWCDWVSFDPRMPASMQLFVKRIPRDDAMIASLEGEVRLFLREVTTKVAALTARYQVAS